MNIIEVKGKALAREFLEVARIIYNDDKNWVCPLDNDIEAVFDPQKNTYFNHGTASRWVLKSEKGKLLGRIAAFIDRNTLKDNDQPTGGCGFFECINDQEAANILFTTARDWLKKQNIEAMDGPINFGETEKYWGLLVGGFTQPAYNVAYHRPYYQQLFETYGFKVYYKMEGFHFNLQKPISERFRKIAKRVHSNPDYSFEHLKYSNLEKYVSDFTEVFNTAWASFKDGFEPISKEYVRGFIKEAKAIAEEKFIWFAYHKGRPVAIYLMIPDVNQIFKSFNGSLSLLNKLRLLYMVRTKKMTRAKGILMGVIPEFQNKGIESAFILEFDKIFAKMKQYTELEFSFVADFNPPMRKLWVAVGAEPAKQYITYRYMFDRNAKFSRYPLPE